MPSFPNETSRKRYNRKIDKLSWGIESFLGGINTIPSIYPTPEPRPKRQRKKKQKSFIIVIDKRNPQKVKVRVFKPKQKRSKKVKKDLTIYGI